MKTQAQHTGLIGWWCPKCDFEYLNEIQHGEFASTVPGYSTMWGGLCPCTARRADGGDIENWQVCVPMFKPLDTPEPCRKEKPEIWTYSDKYGNGVYRGRYASEYSSWLDDDKPHRAYQLLNRCVYGEPASKRILAEMAEEDSRDNPFINAARGRDPGGINEDEVRPVLF